MRLSSTKDSHHTKQLNFIDYIFLLFYFYSCMLRSSEKIPSNNLRRLMSASAI